MHTDNPLSFIHGGAFRDPDNTSRDILSTLPRVFDPDSPFYCEGIRGIASINYRLSPYPNHATNPSRSTDRNRNVKWPEHIKDVRDVIGLIMSEGEESRYNLLEAAGGIPGGPGPKDTRSLAERKYILTGHSVGATMALKCAEGWILDIGPLPPAPFAVIGFAGIYNFPKCRNAHPADAELYTEIFNNALGLERNGAWAQAVTPQFRFSDKTKIVVVVCGEEDTLVEKKQIYYVVKRIVRFNSTRNLVKRAFSVPGGHDELLTNGAIANCLKHVEDILMGTEIRTPINQAERLEVGWPLAL